ncbi:MAG: dihydroorotase [Flavobacteriaceae bacterium]|nr:dihydroorotase [Flavobacteriaceae bacterium]
MNILIKSATILDSTSEYHNATKDILIENGSISKIDDNITNPDNYQEIALDNLHISIGWIDTSVSFGEPGYEHRETIANGIKTAALSGFTSVCLNANTHPIIDTHSDVSFLKSKAQGKAVNILPIGALTRQSKGVDLAEMYDMKQAGAVAFGDYQHAVDNANLLKISLQYAQNSESLVLSFPMDTQIKGKGIVNEEVSATRLGLKGIAALAEELHIARDLQILEYTGGKLHIPTISSEKSVELIAEAKKKGLDISCSVAVHNLVLTDDVLETFETNYKVMPPLRTRKDRQALLKGVQDGTIDYVTSDHNPIDIELKKIEFDHAEYGTIGLESAFGALNSILDTEKVIDCLTRKSERFGHKNESIKEGIQANLSLFNPEGEYVFNKEHIHSKSHNSAFLGMTLKGKVYGIINNNQVIIGE